MTIERIQQKESLEEKFIILDLNVNIEKWRFLLRKHHLKNQVIV